MEINRRSFMTGVLIAGCAPAIVRAESLMSVIGFDTGPSIILLNRDLILPGTVVGTGVRTFTVRAHSKAAIECTVEGLRVIRKYESREGSMIQYELAKMAPREYGKLIL